ncbi:DUF2726 domain-containing protein [Brachyspira murdochii]|uniref:DUF2726 domain-containing protein n=1 Tax=Brachyspira murdochii TaxID=84378 RepID=A0ABX5B5Y2_9SPIR|nr:DUF2726 domain-containing protein [Brachyspira murdochii]PPS22691.1 hypothetical protein DJ52_03410 [Brachyspira murdochii]
MAIIGAVLFLVIILFAISKMDNRTKSCGYKKNYYRRYRKYKKYNKYIKKDITELRLENMDTGNISTKKIMNIEETKIFFLMLKVFKDYNIYKQVSFKAFLDAEENTDVWKTFRDFYCDFLITHKKGNKINEPIAVIEYDGAGHFGNNEDIKEKIKNNDLIKEKLIQKAGMKYFIIKEKDIKINDKFIDDKKLENFLNSIIISLKSNN